MPRADGLKNAFVTGSLLIAPLVVTLFVLGALTRWSLRLLDPVARGTRLARYTANNELAAQVLAGITFLGYLARWSVGRHLFGNFGRVVNVVPLVNTIYVSVRGVANSLVDRDSRYESVVLVEHPREGLYSIGLVTGACPDAIETATGQPMLSVYLPNSPNPAGGRLVLVPDDQVRAIDMSVREGMRLLVTTGMGFEEGRTALPPAPDGDVAAR